MLSVKTDRPLDPLTLTILRTVARVTKECNVDYFIVGATARDILLTHVFGMDVRRATSDVDFAIAVEDWEQFENIKTRLIQIDGFYASRRLNHRMFFRSQNTGLDDGYPFDLVPFGGIEESDNIIAWPPDMSVMMNVTGYGEVLKATEEVEVSPNQTVRVASLAGLSILKLFAWVDRGLVNSKDAQDLYQIMQNYGNAGNMDRLYGDEFSILEAAEYDPVRAGVCLLGNDIATLANGKTYKKLIAILDDESQMKRLAINMVGPFQYDGDALTKVEQLLDLFKRGMHMSEK